MERVLQLVEAVRLQHPSDRFFDGFEEQCRAFALKRRAYEVYERAFLMLDDNSWSTLKKKACRDFKNERAGALKQGFFNQLNEAFAYAYLVECGYQSVSILPERGQTVPDISFEDSDAKWSCEVKSIGVSDALISRRASGKPYSGSLYAFLPTEFFRKVESDLRRASSQLGERGGLVFLFVTPDDFTGDHTTQYITQFEQFLATKDECPFSICVQLSSAGTDRIKRGALAR